MQNFKKVGKRKEISMNYQQSAKGQEAWLEYINVQSSKVKVKEHRESILDILDKMTKQET